MNNAPKDYEEDELIVVKLPRKDVNLLKEFLEKQAASNWLMGRIKTHWIWLIGTGVLTLMYMYNEIKAVFNGH